MPVVYVWERRSEKAAIQTSSQVETGLVTLSLALDRIKRVYGQKDQKEIMGKHLYSCWFYVNHTTASYEPSKRGDLVKVERMFHIGSIVEALHYCTGFSLKMCSLTPGYDQVENLAWADDLQNGEQEVIVSADSLEAASSKAIIAWKDFGTT